jgi:peptide deformylase
VSILDIKTYPDSFLKQKSAPVEKNGKDLQQLIENMTETMHAASGVGLAAPQVGVHKRLIVIDVHNYDGEGGSLVLINPEIVSAEDMIDSEEGCLSVPGFTAHLKRAGRVIVKGLDRDFNAVEFEATGILARAVQHEIDHLDGVLIVDRLSAIKREFFEKRYKKAHKEQTV